MNSVSKKYFFIFFINLFFINLMSFNLKAQTSFTALTHIKTTADFFTSDNQANVYVAKGNELFKYNKQGKLLYKYSTKKYSNISFVDAGNLLRILLFYKDFLLVEFLDNTLSLNSDALSLEQIGYYQTQLVCTSNNSGTWLFDMQNFELIRLSKTLEITNRSGNLSSILNIDFLPTYLIENDNRVFLNNPKTGILVFDIYGTYFKTIPYQNVQSFQVVSDWVYIKTEKNILAYNIITSEEKTFDIPISDFKKFRIENNYLLLQLPDEIIIYEEK